MTSKIRTIKFNRDPRFTPASLPTDRLSEIENIAYRVVEAMVELGHEAQKFTDIELGCYLNPAFCERFGIELPADLDTNDDLWNYLRTSTNFLVACAGKRGWLKPYGGQIKDRRSWAAIRGY